MSNLFKDLKEVNQKSNCEVPANKLWDAAQKGNDAVFELLFGNTELTEQSHKYKHNNCTGFTDGNDRITEKRICKCFYYLNNDHSKNCTSCNLFNSEYMGMKIHENCDYSIVDYEVPNSQLAKSLGEVDLLLTDQVTLFATEVKPPKSKETLLRMITEILTYTWNENLFYSTTVKNKYGDKKIAPAICFFEGSNQEDEYNEALKDNNSIILRLIDHFKIAVFCISQKEDKTAMIDYINMK